MFEMTEIPHQKGYAITTRDQGVVDFLESMAEQQRLTIHRRDIRSSQVEEDYLNRKLNEELQESAEESHRVNGYIGKMPVVNADEHARYHKFADESESSVVFSGQEEEISLSSVWETPEVSQARQALKKFNGVSASKLRSNPDASPIEVELNEYSQAQKRGKPGDTVLVGADSEEEIIENEKPAAVENSSESSGLSPEFNVGMPIYDGGSYANE